MSSFEQQKTSLKSHKETAIRASRGKLKNQESGKIAVVPAELRPAFREKVKSLREQGEIKAFTNETFATYSAESHRIGELEQEIVVFQNINPDDEIASIAPGAIAERQREIAKLKERLASVDDATKLAWRREQSAAQTEKLKMLAIELGERKLEELKGVERYVGFMSDADACKFNDLMFSFLLEENDTPEKFLLVTYRTNSPDLPKAVEKVIQEQWALQLKAWEERVKSELEPVRKELEKEDQTSRQMRLFEKLRNQKWLDKIPLANQRELASFLLNNLGEYADFPEGVSHQDLAIAATVSFEENLKLNEWRALMRRVVIDYEKIGNPNEDNRIANEVWAELSPNEEVDMQADRPKVREFLHRSKELFNAEGKKYAKATELDRTAEKLIEQEKPELADLIRRAVDGVEMGYRARRTKVDAGHAIANAWDDVLTQRDQLAERATKAAADWQTACEALVGDNKHRRVTSTDEFWTAADQLKTLGESVAFREIRAVLDELPQKGSWTTKIFDFVASNNGQVGNGELASIRAASIARTNPEEFIKIESSAGQIGQNRDSRKSYGSVWLNGVDRINNQLSTQGQSLPIELSGKIKGAAQRAYLAERDRLYAEEVGKKQAQWDELRRDLVEREVALNERCENLTERSRTYPFSLADFESHKFSPSGVLYESLKDVFAHRDALKQEITSRAVISKLAQEMATIGKPGFFTAKDKRARYEQLQAEIQKRTIEYSAIPARIQNFETVLKDLEARLNGTR